MGKKKSVALIILVTVVLAALLFISVTPPFYVNATQKLTSLLSTVDLGADLGGGYSVVYYPEGVISGEEYVGMVANYEESKADGDTEVTDPADEYTAHKGIYLSDTIVDGDSVTEKFRTEFESAFRALQIRYEGKNFTDYTIKLQDDYTIVVEVPDVQDKESVSDMFTQLAYSGSLIFSDTDTSTNTKNILMTGDASTIKSAKVVDLGEDAGGFAVAINLTKEGRSQFAQITADLASAAGDSGSATLYMYVGTEVLMQAGVSSTLDQSTIYISGSFTTRESAETVACVINSLLDEDNVFDLHLDASQIYTFAPTMGENVALIAAIVIGAAILIMIIYALVRYKGMGLAHVYGFLTYTLAMVLCIALIDAVCVSAAGLLAIVISAVLMVGFNFYAFRNIRDEFYTGKTLTAAIKSGYKKSLALTIDAHAVLFLISLIVYLIALGSAQYMALILMLGAAISAACTLAVTRFYLYMFLAQPKNKIAFCSFKREETEDE